MGKKPNNRTKKSANSGEALLAAAAAAAEVATLNAKERATKPTARAQCQTAASETTVATSAAAANTGAGTIPTLKSREAAVSPVSAETATESACPDTIAAATASAREGALGDDLSAADGILRPQAESLSYVQYLNHSQMSMIMQLIQKDLSEPYSIYTFRYFINNWPSLCFLTMDGEVCVGAIVCKLDDHRGVYRGYIAMLAVDNSYRKRGIGTRLVQLAINAMQAQGCEEVVLETELSNRGALALYQNLGFVRDKRLAQYYLNSSDAFRLKLWLT